MPKKEQIQEVTEQQEQPVVEETKVRAESPDKTNGNRSTAPKVSEPKLDIDWKHIIDELRKPFEYSHIKIKPGKVASNGQALALWYIDARAVMDRLDAVVGPENWQFNWVPIPSEGRVVIQGMLTIHGVTKSDVGEAKGEDEPWKSGVSDSFKRTAVQFGVGRFLYRLPQFWWPYDEQHKRFAQQEELNEFVQKVMRDLSEAEGDITQIDIKQYSGRSRRESSTERKTYGGEQSEERQPEASKGEITPAQDGYIRRLYGQKFGRYANGNVLFANFLKRTIGRACPVEKLSKSEADSVIKALQDLATANAA